MEEIITELTNYFATMQEFDKDSAQDGQALHAYLIQLTQMMSRANYLKAEYNKLFRQQKKTAYINLAASSEAQKKYWSATQGKDFVDAQCYETGFIYDLADRCSASAVHTLDAVRTILSDLRSERQFAQYQV